MGAVGLLPFACAAFALAASGPANAAMQMRPEAPAQFKPASLAYSANHQILVRLLSVPASIPFERYFALRFGVYDGRHPQRLLTNSHIRIFAGMRHGLKRGFAHGMQSAPRTAGAGGIFIVSGMYFHMMGPWVVKLWVTSGARHGIVYFTLPCCSS